MSFSFDPNREYTKKEIQDLTGLAPNTIYETIKACGLSSSKRAYTGQELERFVRARGLLEGGGTYDDVRQAFRLKTATTVPENSDYPEGEEGEGVGFAGEVSQQIAESVRAIVIAGVKDLVPYIPKMAAMALEEVARSGAIRDAFAEARNAYLSSGRSPNGHQPTPPLIVSVEPVPQEPTDVDETSEPDSTDEKYEDTSDVWK
ncbi:hypothetical protein NDI52_07310 [Leptolyngbya sp. PL-A3]|uniref:hypothetical protein n=1 Tax=Leptolyngbya sp. PL-A3 TaxID=2933911 RepID=UPI00329960E2